MTRSVSGVLAIALASGSVVAMIGGSVAPEFRGECAPAKVECNSRLRLVIEANVVTFVNCFQQAAFRKLEQCFSCLGHDASGITLLSSTDAMGDSPFRIYFDGTKKRQPVVSSVELSNDKRLGERFPLGTAALKK